MGYKRLFIWVEGEDDERIFKNLFLPNLQKKYDWIKIIRYGTLKNEKINNYLKSIKAMKAEYICVTDINDSPCITKKKQEKQNQLKNIDSNNIIVVIKEIEGWYLAGLNDTACNKLKINKHNNTDEISKERFNNIIPDKFDSRIDFMVEILKYFSIKTAKQKNKSFDYFIKKYDYMI